MLRQAIVIGLAIGLVGGALAVFGGDKPNPPSPGAGRSAPAESTGRAGGWRRGRLSDEQQAELLAAIKEHFPDRHKALVRLRERNPALYRGTLRRLWRWYQHVKDLPPEQRELFRREQQVRVRIARLGRAMDKAVETSQRQALEKQFRAAVAEQFDIEQKKFEYRLARLEEHVKRLRAELKDREERRAALIDQRVEKLLERDWSSPAGRGPRGRVGGRGPGR